MPHFPPVLAKYPDLVMRARIEIIRTANSRTCKKSCNEGAIIEKYLDIARKRDASFRSK